MTALDSARIIELHKLLADWGEGTSQATGEEGQGAPATPNDATWRHRFFDTIFWTNDDGDFSATVSASQSVGPVGQYTWSSAQMVADVQSWLENPASNFGWLVLGDESTIITSRRFDTRETANPPVLTIQYIAGARVLPTPRPRPTPSAASISPGIRYPALFTLQRSLPQVAACCGVSQADQTRCVSCTKQPGSKPVRPYHSRK